MNASLTETLLSTAVSNSVVSLGLAVLAIAAARLLKSPALSHCLWVLVLLKLITPPLFEVAVPLPDLPATQLVALDGWFTQPTVTAPSVTAQPAAPALITERAATTDWSGWSVTIWWLGTLLAGSFGLYRAA